MKKVKTLYDLVLDLTDKNAGRYFTEDEFNRALRTSELEYFDECIGATNKKLDNRTNVAYGKSQDTDARLEPFRKNVTRNVVDGELTLPNDCGKITGVYTSRRTPKAIKRIDEDRLGVIFDNPLRSPNEDEIYYLEEKKSLLIFGILESAYITYLKIPTAGKYASKEVTVTSGTRTVKRREYDDANSVDVEWNERELLDLANRILAKLAIPMKDAFLTQSIQVNKTNE